jgi:hypothetical protein
MSKTTPLALLDLKAINYFLVIGEPNALGQIVAQMMRISAAPPLTLAPYGL